MAEGVQTGRNKIIIILFSQFVDTLRNDFTDFWIGYQSLHSGFRSPIKSAIELLKGTF